MTVRHEGDVVGKAGNEVYFVGARVNWYPRQGAKFAQYDVEFRYPKTFSLVASGDETEERTEGDERVSLRRSSSPQRFAGFNLGNYRKTSVARGPYRVDAYANMRLEQALDRPMAVPLAIVSPFPRRTADRSLPAPMSLPAVSPSDRLETLAHDVADEFEWMASKLGPPPVNRLSVSPIPGQFGQGFPGLLYLSTLAYVDLPERIGAARETRLHYSELLHAHETAHQWWGNLVASPGYEDDWLQEAIAGHLALMALERKRGRRDVDSVLDAYRERLLQKNEDGQTIESMGPVVLGLRLESSRGAGAWRSIVYDKGAWILHMLRRRLGDAAYWKTMAGLIERYRYAPLSTAQFQEAAANALMAQPAAPGSYREADPKLETFFDSWVYGTGIPALKLSWKATGKAPRVTISGTVAQSEAGADFTDAVPVEIQFARGKSVVRWVRTGPEPAVFTVTAAAAPVRVILDPENAVLKR
jgi:hypothetical protein